MVELVSKVEEAEERVADADRILSDLRTGGVETKDAAAAGQCLGDALAHLRALKRDLLSERGGEPPARVAMSLEDDLEKSFGMAEYAQRALYTISVNVGMYGSENAERAREAIAVLDKWRRDVVLLVGGVRDAADWRDASMCLDEIEAKSVDACGRLSELLDQTKMGGAAAALDAVWGDHTRLSVLEAKNRL